MYDVILVVYCEACRAAHPRAPPIDTQAQQQQQLQYIGTQAHRTTTQQPQQAGAAQTELKYKQPKCSKHAYYVMYVSRYTARCAAQA